MSRRDAAAGSAREPSITRLSELVEALSRPDREAFDRMFTVTGSEGRLLLPAEMVDWARDRFGSVDRVERQTCIKVTNRVTYEETLFNELRASRPVQTEPIDDPDAAFSRDVDAFCDPGARTPADVWGRIQGAYCVTASNVAKYAGAHGLVVFREHHPLRLEREAVVEYLDVALRWAERMHAHDPEAAYVALAWNASYRAGASVPHGHLHVVATRDGHFARIEQLRAAAAAYRGRHSVSYFADFVRVHDALGLTLPRGDAKILCSLSPVKERETWILAPGPTTALKDATYEVLHSFRRLGVTSFNLIGFGRPLRPVPGEDWSDFPFIVRIVDRGPRWQKTADVAAMEIWASSVVASDPFRLVEALTTTIGGRDP